MFKFNEYIPQGYASRYEYNRNRQSNRKVSDTVKTWVGALTVLLATSGVCTLCEYITAG